MLMQGAAWFSVLMLAPFMLTAASAQVTQHHAAPAHKTQPGPNELAERVAAAAAARDSGNSVAIARANYLVIGAALREIAELRVLESDEAKAIELYRSSLQYEDTPGTYAAMAFAEIQAGDFDQAVQFAQKALAAEPGNLRAEEILASAYDQKGNYAEAIEPFTWVAQADPTVENLYPLAECLLQTKKPEDKARAVAVFEQMKKIAGDSGSLHVLFGRAYRDGGDMKSAVSEFERAIAMDPRTPHAHYFLGLAQLVLNEWNPTPGAEAAIRTEAEYYPNDYLANYMLGFLLSGERQYEESTKYLVAASRISPSLPDPFLYLGLNAFSQEKMDIAEQMLRKAVELTGSDEGRANYQIRRAYVDLARILFASGRQKESEGFAAKARALQNKTMVETQQTVSAMMLSGGVGAAAAVMPLSPKQEKQSAPTVEDSMARGKLTPEQAAAAEAREKTLRTVLALAFNDLATSEAVGGQYALALDNYQQAERWDNTLPGIEKNLGLCAFRAKDYAEAVRALSQALPLDAHSTGIRAMLGVSYFATDEFAEAARTFEPLGTRAMQDGETGYAWAASLAHTGDLKKATEVLTAFEAEPRSNDIQLLIGQLWTVIGDYARANAVLEQALAFDPSLLKAHFYKGMADIHWAHWPEAEREFQAELGLDPYDHIAQYHLGFVYLQESRIDDALKLFQQVVAAHPDYPNAQYELGKILLDRGQLEDALGHLEVAARLSPEADFMHYQLQAAYRKLGRTAEADRELEIYKGLKAKSRERIADKLKQMQ